MENENDKFGGGVRSSELQTSESTDTKFGTGDVILHAKIQWERPGVCVKYRSRLVFTARWTIVQSAVLLSHFVCLSVCLSVCDVGGSWPIGWKSWKLIARTISPTSLLFAAQRSSTVLPGEHGEILGRLEMGWEKVACWNTKVAIPLKPLR